MIHRTIILDVPLIQRDVSFLKRFRGERERQRRDVGKGRDQKVTITSQGH